MDPTPVPPAVSPTGKAVFVPPAWVTFLAGILATGCYLTLQAAPVAGVALPGWVKLALLVVSGLGLGYGIVSVGARLKNGAGTALAAILCASLLFAGCKTPPTPLEASLLDCGSKAAASAASQFAPQVGSILAGQSPNWNADLADLLAVGGPAVLCALEAVISSLEHGVMVAGDVGGAGEGAPGLVMPIGVQLSRAYAFQAQHPARQ